MANEMKLGELKAIVDSQATLYGNHALFLKNDTDKPFILFAGPSTEYQLLECVSYFERCDRDGSLEGLLERMDGLDDELLLYCSDDKQQAAGFRVGFKSPEGFVETFNSNELVMCTIIEDEV
jgi:hypothetical protein